MMARIIVTATTYCYGSLLRISSREKAMTRSHSTSVLLTCSDATRNYKWNLRLQSETQRRNFDVQRP